jgi:hypothetical protein
MPTWWRDADADGFGSSRAETLCAAEQPTGYVDNSRDCCDADALVFPGQTAWLAYSSVPCTVAGGAPYWDYDCSTVVEQERTNCGACTPDSSSGTCILTVGWRPSGDACFVGCGLYWEWITSCGMPGCSRVTSSVQQRCH